MAINGGCKCGAVRWQGKGDIFWQSYCHCEACRRATSAPVAAWFSMKVADVSWSGPLVNYQSGHDTMRGFCEKCGTPLYYQTAQRADEIDLYGPSRDDPENYQPEAHFFYGERLSWLEIKDDLPKYLGGEGSELYHGK